MPRDMDVPSNWNQMSESERTAWLALWMTNNVEEHARIGKMNREKAKEAVRKGRILRRGDKRKHRK